MQLELTTKTLDALTLEKAIKSANTDRKARGLEPFKTAPTRIDIGDTSVGGLTIRVTKRRLAWCLTYISPVTGKAKREGLGTYGKAENGGTSLAIAHDRARALKQGVFNKIDPQLVRLETAPAKTFGEVVEMRLARDVFGMSKTADEIALRYRTKFAHLKDLPIKAFKVNPHYNDLIRAHEDKKQRRSIERIRSDLSVIFDFAVEKAFVDSNPIPKRKKRKGGAKGSSQRARSLSPQEIVTLWHAVGNVLSPRMAIIIQLLIVLGQRCGEVCGMANSEIVEHSPTDWVWVLPGNTRNPQTDQLIKAGRTKNGHTHEVPLSALAIKLVKAARALAKQDGHTGDQLFARKGKPLTTNNIAVALWEARTKQDDAFGIGDWTAHMLRHTVVTGMGALGVSPSHRSKVVNHSMVEAAANEKANNGWGDEGSEVTKGYDHHNYIEVKRAALDLWGKHIAKLVDPTGPQLKLVA